MDTTSTTTRASRRLVLASALAALIVGIPATAAAQSLQSTESAGSLDFSDESLITGAFSLACQYSPGSLEQTCTDLEPLTREDPLALKLNPIGTHIVILGAGLFPDGTIRPILDQRLQVGLRLAQTYPTAPIIVSGGAPQNNRTEAAAMYDWLVGAGVNPARIIREDRSANTVQNAEFSARILADRGATAAVIVTNDFHLKRAMSNFRDSVGGTIPITGVVA